MKKLSCADLGAPQCNYEAKGESDDEVINKMIDHANRAHSDMMKEMQTTMSEDEIKDSFREKITEE